jgi:hypothetical protein
MSIGLHIGRQWRRASEAGRYATPSAMEKEIEARRVAAVEYRD